jgi:hypothetical protein
VSPVPTVPYMLTMVCPKMLLYCLDTKNDFEASFSTIAVSDIIIAVTMVSLVSPFAS